MRRDARRARADGQDWHVDFAASSVYYHIHTGAKELYFIRPTEQNLKAYATWSGSAELQQREWLGDMCEGGVEKVRLLAGDTMFIPAGYIHAVVSIFSPSSDIQILHRRVGMNVWTGRAMLFTSTCCNTELMLTHSTHPPTR